MKRRVVITGMGAVSPIGCGVDRMWENAGNGVCGIDYIKSFDTEGMAVKIAAEASDFDPSSIMDKMQARRTARFTQFALAAAKEAFTQSGLDMSANGYINAHGTSTPMNDRCETAAVKLAFGDHAYKLMMSSTKSMTGHLLGASGGVEAILTVMALKDGFVPPTAGYEKPDPDCDLDIVPNRGRKADIEYAMSNSLGFGGHNASVVFRRYE